MRKQITERFIRCYEDLRSSGKIRSARQFALAIDCYPQSWNEVLKGRRDVTLDQTTRAVQVFQFNPHYLFYGEGPPIQSKEVGRCGQLHAIVMNESQKQNIWHVPVKAHAGYAAGAHPLETVDKLLTYTLPGMEQRLGIFRSFEVTGPSMSPTIESGQIVVCRYVQPDFWQKQVQDGRIYVVVSREDLVVKRVKNRIKDHGALHLISDNSDFEPYMMPAESVQELWYVEQVIAPLDQTPYPAQSIVDSKDLTELIRLQSSLIEELKGRAESSVRN